MKIQTNDDTPIRLNKSYEISESQFPELKSINSKNKVKLQKYEDSVKKEIKIINSTEDKAQNESKNSDMSAIENEIYKKQKELDWSFKEGELDFQKKLFPIFEQRNMITSPYTFTLIEDAMYVDEGVIISLQYHIYNDDQEHIILTDITQEIQSGITISKLNTQNYQKEGKHPMSSFKNLPKNFEARDESFEDNHPDGKIMTAKDKELKQSFKIEGILCFFRAYVSGNMEKVCERSFNLKMPFAYTRQGNMTLQVTNDRQVLHLTYLSDYSETELKQENDLGTNISDQVEVKIMAWEIDTKTCTFKDYIGEQFKDLNKGLSYYLRKNQKQVHLIRNLKLTTTRNYFVLTFNQQTNRQDSKAFGLFKNHPVDAYINPKPNSKKIARKVAIFEVQTGKLIFEFGGTYQNWKIPDTENERIYNLGLIVHDTEYTNHLNEEGKKFYKVKAKPEEIAFFCAGNFCDWQKKYPNPNHALTNNYPSKLNGNKKIIQKDYDWTLAIK